MINPQIEELRKRYNENKMVYNEIELLFSCISTLDK